ncbi:MAG: secretin N-terminal domain-containing protein [Candidatus Omnitrophota bacterium]|nr:secretin N-terminal domain-containing protein [Candidatus Omnitrophota bacterium]
MIDRTNRSFCRLIFSVPPSIVIIAILILSFFSAPALAQAGDKEKPPAAAAVESAPMNTAEPQNTQGIGAANETPKVEAASGAQQLKNTEEPKSDTAPEPEAVNAEVEIAPVDPGNVTVNFKDADIRTVLTYIAEVSGVDIVPAPDVKGVVDLKLTNKPWNVALDIIVRNYGFAYEREGDIIRVVTIDKLKQEELATQTIALNYGKSKDVVNSIKDIVSDRGRVMYDERTNTVLVTDIPTNLYKIAQIIEKLDKKTDQVLIEARVIETILDDSEKLGIDWNVKVSAVGAKRPTTLPFEAFKTPFNTKSGEGQAYFPQVQTASPQSTTVGLGGATITDTSAEFPTGASGVFSFPYALKDQFTFGTLDFSEFKVVLELIKSRANTDIVSNPRIATLNNSEASISVGQTLGLPTYERNSETGKMGITGYEAKELGIILKVTPHVNDKREIVVDLAPEISDLLRYDTLDRASGVVAPVFSTRKAKTQIMIRDGDTIFIGGLIKENDVDTRKKLPFLGDIFGDVPYFGLLFTKKEIVKQKTELIFFITVNLMTADKKIKDLPSSNKAYVPMYTATQTATRGKDEGSKKRLKKKF